MDCGNAVRAEVQVKSEMMRLAKIVQELSGVIVDLEKRVEPIIRNEPTACGMEQQKDPVCLVPLANEIRVQSKSVSDSINYLRSIIGRMEL